MTRWQGTDLSSHPRITFPTARAAPRWPAIVAISPYVATRPGGIARTSAYTRRANAELGETVNIADYRTRLENNTSATGGRVQVSVSAWPQKPTMIFTLMVEPPRSVSLKAFEAPASPMALGTQRCWNSALAASQRRMPTSRPARAL